MSLNLGAELTDAAKAIGLLDPNGGLNKQWFNAPDTALSHILSNPDQRAAFLNLLDGLLPVASVPGTPAGEKWHPLLGVLPSGNLYLSVASNGSVKFGMAAEVTSHGGPGIPTATLRAHLPIVSCPPKGGGNPNNTPPPVFIAGGDDGPLDFTLGLQLNWTRPQYDIALAAIRGRVRLVPLAASPRSELNVVLEGLDLDGSGAHDVELDPSGLSAEAMHVVLGLLRQKLHELSSIDPDAKALIDNLMPLLGLAPGRPAFPFATLLTDPAALQNWFKSLIASNAMGPWLANLAGLFGSTLSYTGSGTPADPWSVKAIAFDAGGSGLSFTLSESAQKLQIGLLARALPAAANPAARLEARAVIANIPLAGKGAADVLPLAEIVVRAPGGAASLVAPGGNFSADSLRAGLRWNGSALQPVLELSNVNFAGHAYPVLDLTSANTVEAAANGVIQSTILQALGSGPGQCLAALAGLVPPSTDPGSPHAVDLAQLVANPAAAIAAVHRAALLDPNHHWGHLLGEVAGLLGMQPSAVTGLGTIGNPWVFPLSPGGPLTLQLAAWDAQTVPADPHRKLRIGLRLAAQQTPWTFWYAGELLAVDLPASGSNSLSLMAGQHASFTMQPVSKVPVTAGITMSADSVGFTMDWNPGGPMSMQGVVQNLSVTSGPDTVTVNTIQFPPPQPFNVADPVGSLGIPVNALETLLRILIGRGAYHWAGMEGLASCVLLGIYGRVGNLQSDWPTLRDPNATPGSLFTAPLDALRDWLARVSTGVSANGTPFLPPTLDWLRAILAGELPNSPQEAPLAESPLGGSGIYDDPWRLPVLPNGTTPIELLTWLEPAGPPVAWISNLAAAVMGCANFESLLQTFSALRPFLPQVREALAHTDVVAMAASLGNLEGHLASSDGVIPVTSQIPAGGDWTAGVPLTCAHQLQPSDNSAITQVLNSLMPGSPVLLLGPAFSDHTVWQAFLNQAPGVKDPSATFNLRVPGVDPASVDLRGVTAVADYYTADLADDGTGNLPVLTAQIARVVARISSLKAGTVNLVAHSTAGVAARAFTEANPTLVAKLITIGSPHGGAPLNPLTQPDAAEGLRFLERLSPPLATGPINDAIVFLRKALDGYLPPAAPGGLPVAFPFSVGSFTGTVSTSTSGVPALALGGTLSGGLLPGLKQAIAVMASTATASSPPAPTHLAFGVRARFALPLPAMNEDTVQCSVRADAGRVALDKKNVGPQTPAFTFQTTLWNDGGWLVGSPLSFTGIATPPGEVRVKWAELGAKTTISGGSATVSPFVRLHHVGFHGPASAVVDLSDPRIEPLIGAVLSAISRPAPSLGSPVDIFLTALEAVGLAVPDNSGGVGLSADAFAALLVDPAGFLAPRLAAALAASGLLGLSGPPSGPWTMPLPGGFAEFYLASGPPWQPGVRTTIPSLALGVSTGITFDARIGLPDLTPALDLSVTLGAVTLTRTEPGGQLTLAASPWLEPLPLLPAPPANTLSAAWNNLVPRLLISSSVSTILEALFGPSFQFGAIDRLLGAPGNTLKGAGSLGNGNAISADRVNMLLGVISAATGAPPGQQGLMLPGGLQLTASGQDAVTLQLETTQKLGNAVQFQLDATIDSLRHMTPGGTLSLDIPLPSGDWQGVTVTFGLSAAGVSLALTPDKPGCGTLQPLPTFSGLGSFLDAALATGAKTLLPKALDALLDALGTPLPPLANLAVNVATQLSLYDPLGRFSAHGAEWQKLLQAGYLSTPRGVDSAIVAMFNDPASPLKGTIPGTLQADPSGQSLTWTYPSAQSPTLKLTAGWTPGPTLLLQATALTSGPLALTLNAGSASGTLQCSTTLGLDLHKVIPIAAKPQFSFAYNGASFDVNFYPLGDAGAASVLDIELLPSAAVKFAAGGPEAFLDQWLVPLIADRVLEANRNRLGAPIWGGGKQLRQLLSGTGLITAGTDQLQVPLPALPVAISNLLLGLVTGAKVPITNTLKLELVKETPINAAAKAVGLRLTGHQDFPAGSLKIGLRFGEGPLITAQNRGLTLYLFQSQNPPAPALQIDAVGLGVAFSDANGSPLINLPVARANEVAGYLFFSFPLVGTANSDLNFGAALEIGGFGIPLGAALSGNAGGDNPVAASLLKSDGSGDPHPVNPDIDVLIGYVNKTFTFKIQGNAAVWIGIRRQFGPIYIEQIGLELGSNPPEASLLVDGSVSISSLTVQADELGVLIPIKSLGQPELWKLDLRGLGISFSSGSVSITGGLLKNQIGSTVEYDGMLSVDIAGKGFTAVGAYSRPEDQYTSLFVFVSLPLVLGGPPFFFVTGLGGGMGYNRELEVPPIAEIPDFMLVKALSDSSLANDPMGALKKMAKYIPARRGSFWLAAGVKFDSFVLVHSVAVIYVAIDKGFEIGLVGVSRLALPTKDLAIVNIELALKARFSSAEGILSIQAQLTDNSYLFNEACQLTGGFAFFIWFPQGQFVLTIGGYHPAFQRPAQFPTVPRLGFRWHVSDAIVIKGEAYFALTNSCVMAGGRLEASAHLGPVRAWFIAHADFLISWDPFYYDISIGVEVGVSVTICIFVCGTLELSLGAELHIMGPPLHGTVSVDITVATITVPFGPDSKPDLNYIHDFEVFRKKYLTTGDKKSKVVNVRATRGLVPKDPPGADPAPGSKAQPWKVAAEFAFLTETRLPGSSYSTFATAPSGQLPGAAMIDLAPMNKQDVISNHDVQLYIAGGVTVPSFTPEHFQVMPVIGKFPEATWHWTDPLAIHAGAKTIPALSGLDIRGVALWGGQSALIPIATLVDDKLVWARPLPFSAGDPSVIPTLQQYGVYADVMAGDTVKVSSAKMLEAAGAILSGGGIFATFRAQLGVRASGLAAMSRHSLAHRRSAAPLITPLSTGLTMTLVSLPAPPPIFRVPPNLPVPLRQARLRAVLQHRRHAAPDSPGRIHTTTLRVSVPNAPRMAPPRAFALVAARLIRIGAPKAPLPTRAATAPRTVHNTEIGIFASPADRKAFAAAPGQLMSSGVAVPAGTTHIWDLPGEGNFSFVLSGAAGARIVFFDRGGSPLLDREMLPQAGQQIAVPPRAAMVSISCLGKLPAGVAAPAPGFGAVSMAAAPARGFPAVGWQAGNYGDQVSALTVLGRGSSLVLPRAAAAIHRNQKTGQSVIRIAQALRGQNGVSTWLPGGIRTVMILLDAQDPTAASNGDLAISADGARLVTPPHVISGGRRRALLYDVLPVLSREGAGSVALAPDHIVIAAGSGGGWEVSGVLGLPGKAIEWVNRLHGRPPRTLTPDGPLTPDGSILVRLLAATAPDQKPSIPITPVTPTPPTLRQS